MSAEKEAVVKNLSGLKKRTNEVKKNLVNNVFFASFIIICIISLNSIYGFDFLKG